MDSTEAMPVPTVVSTPVTVAVTDNTQQIQTEAKAIAEHVLATSNEGNLLSQVEIGWINGALTIQGEFCDFTTRQCAVEALVAAQEQFDVPVDDQTTVSADYD